MSQVSSACEEAVRAAVSLGARSRSRPDSSESAASCGSGGSNSSSLANEAASSDDEDRLEEEPLIELTQEQLAQADRRAQAWAERLFPREADAATAPVLRPSKLARALRLLLSERPPVLAQLMHRCALKEVSRVVEPSHVPAGAPPRAARAPQPLSEEDLAALAWEEQGLLWALAARTLEDDFNTICGACSTEDANDIAHGDKKLSGVDGVSLVYGEVTFVSLAVILARHWRDLPRGRGKFIDIGSGSGKGVFSALLLHEFEQLVGVEILKGLVRSSKEMLLAYQQRHRPALQEKDHQRRLQERQKHASDDAQPSTVAAISTAATPASASASGTDAEGDCAPFPDPSISFFHADFRDLDWSDADIVFVNSTCFDEDLMADLSLYSERLKKGALLITFTKRIRSNHFRLLSDESYPMSWGSCTVYAHRKVRNSEWRPIVKRVIDDVTELDKVMPELPSHLTSQARFEAVQAAAASRSSAVG